MARDDEGKSLPTEHAAPSQKAREVYGAFLERRSVRHLTGALGAEKDRWIETDDLLAALVDNAREPLPEIFYDYLRRRLDGEVRKPRGRGRSTLFATTSLKRLLIAALYDRYEAWLTVRKKACGLVGWPGIRACAWWEGPPSERAARMVQRKLRLNLSWERIRDIAYEQRES